MSALTSAAAILLIGFVLAIAFAAASFIADGWIRRNIPLPEDYPAGEDGEAQMIAEFERIRKAHEARRAHDEKAR